MSNPTIQEIAEHFGSKTKLAEICGVSKAAVSQWQCVPAKYAARVAVASNGKWTAEQIAPDFDWPKPAEAA